MAHQNNSSELSSIKMDVKGVDSSNLTMNFMPSMSGQPVVITYKDTDDQGTETVDNNAKVISYTDPANQITQTLETTSKVPYTDTHNQETDNMDEESFTEALAGEQLLQMANAIVMEHDRHDNLKLEELAHSNDQELSQNTNAVNNEYQLAETEPTIQEIGALQQTIAEITDCDGNTQHIPINVEAGGQVLQLMPVSTEDGSQVYVQVVNSSKGDSIATQTLSEANIQEIMIDPNQLGVENIGQEILNNQEIIIDSLPSNLENLRTELSEDGTIQVFMLEDKNNGSNKKSLGKTLMNVISPNKPESGGSQSSLMTVHAKKYRDVATQITVFPKFSRQGLFDVSTQVSAKDILRDPKTKSLANGTTVIQNSIITQNESTIILNAGNENELILHKCNICGKVYKNKMNWQNHIKLHAQEKVYMCGTCGKIYPRGSLSSHLRTHSELRQIAIFENLPDHLKRKNYKQVPGIVFPNNEASIIELSIADVTTEIDPALFPAPSAEVAVATASLTTPSDAAPEPGAESEVFTENDIPTKMHMEVEAEAEIQEGTKTKFIYKCNVCGKEYNNKSNCHRHLKSHTDTKGFRCGYCGKAFTHRYEVRMHCRTHTGERPYKCPICTRGFNESGNLRRHMKIHEGDNSPFKCGVCFKGFDDTLRLNAHMKVHTGEIVCDVCGKKFGKISDLYRHIKIHSGERPYKCEICSKTFCQKVNLISHQRTHTGQKAFRCDFCGLGFSRKTILQQHIKMHGEEDEYDVERTPVRPIKEEVEIMEADVIEHMESLSHDFVEDGVIEDESGEIQRIVMADGEEVVNTTNDESSVATEG